MDKFISVDEARQTILADVASVPVERLLLDRADGRVLAEEIVAPEDSPPFDNSAMDGYAVRFGDLDVDTSGTGETRLELVGEVAAGSSPTTRVEAGQAMRIFTGAPLPDGADTVVVREVCRAEDDAVVVEEAPSKGQGANIRWGGENMARGEAVFGPGTKLGPGELAVIASFGRTVVYVRRRPRVAIVTTGDEIVEPDRARGGGKIVNSNGYMLETLVRRSGGMGTVWPIVVDDEDAVRTAFRDAAAESDVVVSVGGVSVGDYDYVRGVLDELAGGMHFWKVRMKPGKPLAFGRTENGTAMIGLPGNPVSSFVGYHQFVAPLVAMLQGAERWVPRRLELETTESFRSTPKRRHYVTGALDTTDGLRFRPIHNQSSGNLLAMCGCDAFAVIEEGVDTIAAGERVVVELIG